jgi:hypothetical protein
MAIMARHFLSLVGISLVLLAAWPVRAWAEPSGPVTTPTGDLSVASTFANKLAASAPLAVAQATAASNGMRLGSPAALEASASPLAGERLSDWLLRQAPDAQAYPLGLVWQLPAERAAQTQLKADLLAELAQVTFLDGAARANLQQLTQALPVTGRVHLPMVDARWLQANPVFDPVLQADHVLRMPKRPSTVSVLTFAGEICTLAHQPGAQARHYLTLCEPQHSLHMERAWVVQADGSVNHFLIAFWNEQPQSEPAPGALIGAHWPGKEADRLSRLLTEFLATQPYRALLSESVPAKRVANTPLTPPGPAAFGPLFTANDWGTIGLLQTPTARMARVGDARFHFSRVYPYERFNVFLQPFDAFEVGFRYSTVLNRLYGPAELSGAQTYKDKSIDFKVRLFEETAYRPQLAVGLIDVGGTGLFSSEYLVANKRFGRLDASLGLAWGYLGASGNIKNPMTALGPEFATRGGGAATGGQFNTQAFFRGPTAVFGGVQYQPWDNWVFKAEYDGNNYRSEPQNNNREQNSPVNLGVVYRSSPSVYWSVGLERGNTWMLGLTLSTGLPRLGAPKLADAPKPRVMPGPGRQEAPESWMGTAADVSQMSAWGVQTIRRDGPVLQVVLEGVSGAHWSERIERIAAVLHRDAPASIDTFELVLSEQGVAMAVRRIDRAAWVLANTTFRPPSQRVPTVVAMAPSTAQAAPAVQDLWTPVPAKFGYAIVPSWQQNIGGPDGFLLFRAGVSVPMQWRLSQNVLVSGTVSLNLFDNFDNFKYTAPSNLPRVKTYLREYMTTSRLNMPNLQVTHFGQWSERHFYSLYAGYLETAYAGVGGEWLYRPWNSPLAVGVDVNRVQQRNFNQWFGFDKVGTQTGYRVSTGHATVYWDTGWESVDLKLSAGRYLAGDVGATLDLSKTFDNGVSMGAWATKTNVSAAQFGEGSFDKGLYVRIPFDVMTTKRSGNTAFLAYSPLTRDGGARLNRSFGLFGATTARSQRDTGFVPAPTNSIHTVR